MAEKKTSMQPEICTHCDRVVKLTQGEHSEIRRCTGCGYREINCTCPLLPKRPTFGKPPFRSTPVKSQGD